MNELDEMLLEYIEVRQNGKEMGKTSRKVNGTRGRRRSRKNN